MRIAINTISAQSGAGISMMQNLLPRITDTDNANQYVVFYSFLQSAVIDAVPARCRKVFIRSVPRNPYLRIVWEQLVFPLYLAWYRIDVLYSVGNTTSIFAPCKVVLMMENANPYSHLNLPWSRIERVRLRLLRALGWLSASRATKVRFVSEDSRNLMLSQLGIPRAKCVVIPHGVVLPIDTAFDRAGLGRPTGKYLLTIGANGPHRNTTLLLEAFAVLIATHGYNGNLVIVGNTGSHAWRRTLDTRIRKLGLQSRVQFEGEVPYASIAGYFQGADSLVFPSIEETFGIPLVEAMARGVPIVAADCNRNPIYRGRCFNPFREICGDAAEYFDPFDLVDIAKSIGRLLDDEQYQKILTQRGRERVKDFSLDMTVRKLINLFCDAVA